MTSVDELYRRYLSNPSVCTDTRLLKPGDIFFALKGPSFNGNHFATRAIETGAAYVIVDEEEYVKDERHLLVEDVLTSLQDLARMHRRSLNIPVLAITGSNGKTTTKELVQRVLSAKFRTRATKGNLNNHIGVPLTILSLGPDTEMAVIEMGANHLNEIKQYCSIALPDYGLITNVGKAHLEGFGGFEGVKKGKGELYDWIAKNGKLIFLNADNPHLVSMASDRQVKSFSYGTIADAGIKGELLNSQPFLDIEWRMGNTRKVLQTQLSGEYNFENILAAICVGTFFGVDPAGIERAIASYVPDNSRSQVIHMSGNMILLDAYNANPTSMEAALKNFNALAQPHKLVF
ncbi:MAG: UDP-N-acetylmuramoyl-tripeptide--D-alanyl-D-alanine ligase, partial [Bacteroidia bacterium]|nr:UDP-N-acetylmuramoyl-tripeptide--D-alanyl-D-alanine ligase [Bacteroidia bacterium]